MGRTGLVLVMLASGCVDYLDAGEIGTLRYFDDVRGEPSLRFTTPVSDRDGTTYVLYGSSDVAEAVSYVGFVDGGWRQRCSLHENGSRGVHGWIGVAQDRAWYWSGDALVMVCESESCSACVEVLDTDPSSSADLTFEGVIPRVIETPSRTTTLALIHSPGDRLPFFAQIDLDTFRYAHLEEFAPGQAEAVEVLGTGATDGGGVMIVRYTFEDDVRVEARFIDERAHPTDHVALDGLDEETEDAIVGFLHGNETGYVAGALAGGDLVVFDRNGGGRVEAPEPLELHGVHGWQGRVYAVGVARDRPAVAPLLDNGRFGPPVLWDASARLASTIGDPTFVIDDRSVPVRDVRWTEPRVAVGPFPFVSPHPPHPHAVDSSLLLVAGQTFGSGGEPFTAVAVGPVGLVYP